MDQNESDAKYIPPNITYHINGCEKYHITKIIIIFFQNGHGLKNPSN
jgi:hypothetical protein